MTPDRLFVFSEDQDRFLKLTEEKALSIPNCPSVPHDAKFYIQDATELLQVLMVGKDCN